MAAPKTVLTYPLNGATKDFTIPFEYLARRFVSVTLIGKTRQTLVLNSDYRFTSRTTITTTKAWGPADLFTSVELRRVTSATERLVDFADGSILRAYDLNTAQVQSLHIAEEARDLTADTIGVNNTGDLDARGRKIVNVGDGSLDGDAVNMGQNRRWAESVLNQSAAATASATAAAASAAQSHVDSVTAAQSAASAQVSANASGGAATVATTAKDTAVEYSVAARAYRDQAGASATSASGSAATATAQAGRAKTEADKLGNMNEFASTLDSVSGGIPRFKNSLQVGGSYGVILRKEDVNDPNTAYVARFTHSADGGVRLIDDLRGIVRANFTVTGAATFSNTVDTGGDVIARSGSIRAYAVSASNNSHFWFHGPDASTRAVMYAGATGVVALTPGYGQAGAVGAWQWFPVGDMATPAGAFFRNNGNISSTLYAGGDLDSALKVSPTYQRTRTDMTTSRVKENNYVNDTGRPLRVIIAWQQAAGSNCGIMVNGVEWAYGMQSNVSGGNTMMVDVPVGATYRFQGGNNIKWWHEYR